MMFNVWEVKKQKLKEKDACECCKEKLTARLRIAKT